MDVIDLLSLADRLSALGRFSMERPTEKESVLEHTGFVVLLVLILGEEVNSVPAGDPLDVGLAMKRAAIHDVDEVVTGDIARPTKYHDEQSIELFERLSESAVVFLSERLAGFPAFCRFLRREKPLAKRDREGCLVAIADILAVVYMVWREVLVRSNASMTRQAFTVVRQIDGISDRIQSEFSRAQAMLLLAVMAEARAVMLRAQAIDNPIHGTMREDIR